ncbi:MAG: hypothetical protein MJZ34_07395 [Paludibacteraceae bacterium]|nr:hypothetical protein [Paludibacteraceae bacterium]
MNNEMEILLNTIKELNETIKMLRKEISELKSENSILKLEKDYKDINKTQFPYTPEILKYPNIEDPYAPGIGKPWWEVRMDNGVTYSLNVNGKDVVADNATTHSEDKGHLLNG